MTFNPFLRRNVPLVGILIAYTASVTGNLIASIALPWFVLELTGDAAQTGIVAFVSTIPLILGAFLGGVYVDRVGHRHASIVSDLASSLSVAAIPILYTLMGIQFWQLLILVFIGALLDAPGMTARESLLPEVARLARLPLPRLNAISETIQSMSGLIGPAIAGFLIAGLGSVNALWFTAALSLTAAIASLVMLPSRLGRAVANPNEPYFESFKAGLQFVVRDPLIKALIGLFAALTLISAPLMSVILPVFVQQNYGSAVYLGWLISAYGMGSVIGVIFYGMIGYRVSPHLMLAVSIFAFSFMFIVFAMAPQFNFILAASAIGGGLSAPLNPIVNTVLQQRIPPELRGRILSTVNGVSLLAAPVGLLIAGVLLEVCGIQGAMVAIAGCATVVAIWVTFNQVFQKLEKP